MTTQPAARSRTAMIHHSVVDLGDHGMEARDIVLFDNTDTVANLLAFLKNSPGRLELIPNIDPKADKDDTPF